jgi:para-nitrobenzyl esterase
MSDSEGLKTPISRRALLQTAAAFAVVPASVGSVGTAVSKAVAQEPEREDIAAAPVAPRVYADTPAAPAAPQLFWTTETSTGRVMGIANGNVKEFKGIPYGASTGGRNRYMPPRDATPWTGVRECFSHGQISPQTLSSLDSEYGRLILWDAHAGGMGENCLVLNVWTPSIDRSAKKAVLVSFHGGGFSSGSGNSPGFDGAMMAHVHDVVVVTINHRLSAFGYLNLIDLGASSDFQYAGVCGVMDMTKALEWVRDNIESFGGDPGRVTIFGQSGGGAKTSIMLGNPAAKGLFHRAAVQSGSLIKLADSAAAAKSAELLLGALAIDKTDIASIQRKTWQEILQAMTAIVPPPDTTVSFSPVMDGKYLTHHPFDPSAPVESEDIPVIISSTLHDAALSYTNWDLDADGLRKVVADRFGADQADGIIAAQKAARPQDSNYLIQASILTDASRASGVFVQAERKAALKKAPVYVYQWDWASNMADGKMGAIHGTDVSATFHNVRDVMMSADSKLGQQISFKFSSTWAAFAKTGDPNNTEIPRWEPFTADKRTVLVWDNEIKSVDDYRGELIRMLKKPA